ncbi:hypothetical protein INR49_026310 [Caranx melampygus]|nr:hypothetical protein INR49_026310 [Caranx melampygus]
MISAAPEGGLVFDLDDSDSESGSGSGHWSDLGETANNVESTNINSRMFDSALWPIKDSEEGYVILENGKSYLLNEEVVAAVIGGSAFGVISAIILAIAIYVWHNKVTERCFLGDTEQIL